MNFQCAYLFDHNYLTIYAQSFTMSYVIEEEFN